MLECNKPKRAPPGDTHKYIVKSCHNDIERIIRFGARGYQDYTQHKDPKRKKSFRARHQCDKVTDKNTARYWACEYLWSTKDKWSKNQEGTCPTCGHAIYVHGGGGCTGLTLYGKRCPCKRVYGKRY